MIQLHLVPILLLQLNKLVSVVEVESESLILVIEVVEVWHLASESNSDELLKMIDVVQMNEKVKELQEIVGVVNQK
jgi:hypothetical protein